MPPTLTTKSSETVSAPEFKFVTKALTGEVDDAGRPRFRAIASSTITDRDGDKISLKALHQMRDKFRDGVTIFTDHKNEVFNAYGTTDSAEIVPAGNDPKTGAEVWDLHISGPVNEPSPNAMQLHRSISGGYVKLGCSVDAFVTDHKPNMEKAGRYAIDGIDVFAASIVGVPANQRSWTQKAIRAIKSFHPDEEDNMSENEGLEVPLGAVAELTVNEDGTGEAKIVAEAETPEAEAFHNAAPTDLAPVEVTVGENGPENVAVLSNPPSVCPDCGQSAETTGCDNGFHAVADATEEQGVQASAEEAETPETAPSVETEADPAPEQRAAGLAPEVAELLGHVQTLVKEIGHLREDNASLVAENNALKTQNQTVFGEVELAKKVIEKVMEQPLRSKTAAYVSGFTEVHKLFDPEIAEYLLKRGE